MRWLWFVAPLVLLGVYLAIVLTSTGEDARRKRELARWIDELLGPLKSGKKLLSRRVRAVPDDLARLVEAAGGGARVADVVLLPQLAYLAVRAADGETLSSPQTVVAKLKKPAPAMLVRPLPILDGRPAENTGLAIDDTFGEAFIVEAEPGQLKAVRKWLSDDARAALLDLPAAWLRTEGTTLALTLYGALDADRLDELVTTADALFAEHGASSKSLFGEERAPAQVAREASDVAEGEIAEPGPRVRAGIVDYGLYGVAALLLAMTNGSIDAFHPAALFNSPDLVAAAPWQGGWTTKGVGAFTAALGLMVGLFAYQSYLAATSGRSIGKWLVGLKVVRADGGPVDFMHAVLLRRWAFGALVLALAALMTRPFTTGAWLAQVVTFAPLGLGAGLVALGVATLSRDRDHRGIHDKLADTIVVEAARLRIPSVQLATTRGADPVVFGQAARVLGLAALLVVLTAATFGVGITLPHVAQEAVPAAVIGVLLAVRLALRLARG